MQLKVALMSAAVLSGCGDSTGIRAQFPNTDSRPTVFALNGTPNTVATALLVRGVLPVAPDGNFNFDLAFDFNAANEVVVYTVRAVASQVVPTHRVGLQATTLSFDAATTAPTSGFTFDSSMVVPVGKTIFVESSDPACASSFLGQIVRAKMVIDSVKPQLRQIFVHMLSNPNCGFRSLVPGEPKD